MQRPAWIVSLAVSLALISACGPNGRTFAPHGGSSASPSAYPADMRIPLDMYSKVGSGIAITPVDPASVPQGSIVSQSAAESTALSEGFAGPGTSVFGSGLANVAGLGSGHPTGLYWIVSIDPPNGAHSSGGAEENFFDVFIDANTGKYAAAVSSEDPALPPLPNNTTSSSAPGATEGLNASSPTPKP